MRNLLSNRLYLMLTSVVIAFVLWVTVVSISNPDTTGSKIVAVEERNSSALTSAGKAYTVIGSRTAVISYTVQARDAYKVKSSDFRAYIDLSDIYDSTGSARVVVQTVNNQDIIQDCSAEPSYLQVVVEDIITKTVNVKVYTVDSCPEGYAAAASTTTLTQVDITGPKSLIDSIAVAGVEVSVKEATGTLTGTAELKFYDSDDESAKAVDTANNKYFSASEYTTEYVLYINTTKTIPIQYEVSGTAASGHHYAGSTASIGSVIVTGNADVVGKLSVITIPSSVLNIDGATSNKSWNIDLNTYLPAGAVISGTHETQITALIELNGPGSRDGEAYTGPGTQEQTEAAETSETAAETDQETISAETSDTASAGPGISESENSSEPGRADEGSTHADNQPDSSAGSDNESAQQSESVSDDAHGAQNSNHERQESVNGPVSR